MFKHLCFILILLLFTSCNKSHEATPKVSSSSEKEIEIGSFDKIGNFKGNWIIKQYVDSLKKNKSPYRSQPSGLSNVVINDYTLNENIISFVWSLHDGSSNKCYFDTTKNKFIVYNEMDGVKQNRYEIGFTNLNDDTLLYLFDLEKKSQKIYQKIPDNLNFKSFINILVLSRQYLVKYDKNNLTSDNIITFNVDGSLQGMGVFKRYELFDDFHDNVPQRDLIILYKNEERLWYAWDFKENSLKNLKRKEFYSKKL